MILGSYTNNYDFVENIQQLGFEDLPKINDKDLSDIDALGVPYLFTISDNKIANILLLFNNSNYVTDAYFEMINR